MAKGKAVNDVWARAGPGTAASRYAARLLRAIFVRELWGSRTKCSLPASAVAARRREKGVAVVAARGGVLLVVQKIADQ